jgi:hypothetical protein
MRPHDHPEFASRTCISNLHQEFAAQEFVAHEFVQYPVQCRATATNVPDMVTALTN